MNKEKINWCLKQKNGIEIIEIKPHLSQSYLKEADETLENMFITKGKWKVITAYYACYNALYSILMKSGIKCEIHDCTIQLMSMFEFENKEIKYMEKLKDDRIKTQYYLKEINLKNENEVKDFISKCKNILNNLNSKKIEQIRDRLREVQHE